MLKALWVRRCIRKHVSFFPTIVSFFPTINRMLRCCHTNTKAESDSINSGGANSF